MKQNETLEPKKIAVIAALASGVSITDAAKNNDVGRVTIYRWLSEDSFKSELDTQTALYAEQITSNLMKTADKAVIALTEIIENGENEAVRVRAALGVLTAFPKWRDTNLISRQIEDIKDLLNE